MNWHLNDQNIINLYINPNFLIHGLFHADRKIMKSLYWLSMPELDQCHLAEPEWYDHLKWMWNSSLDLKVCQKWPIRDKRFKHTHKLSKMFLLCYNTEMTNQLTNNLKWNTTQHIFISWYYHVNELVMINKSLTVDELTFAVHVYRLAGDINNTVGFTWKNVHCIWYMIFNYHLTPLKLNVNARLVQWHT